MILSRCDGRSRRTDFRTGLEAPWNARCRWINRLKECHTASITWCWTAAVDTTVTHEARGVLSLFSGGRPGKNWIQTRAHSSSAEVLQGSVRQGSRVSLKTFKFWSDMVQFQELPEIIWALTIWNTFSKFWGQLLARNRDPSGFSWGVQPVGSLIDVSLTEWLLVKVMKTDAHTRWRGSSRCHVHLLLNPLLVHGRQLIVMSADTPHVLVQLHKCRLHSGRDVRLFIGYFRPIQLSAVPEYGL